MIPFRYRTPAKWLLYRLSLGHFFADNYAGFMLPLLPCLARELGFSQAAAGSLLAFSSFASSIMQPLYGWLMDRVPHRNLIAVGVFMASVFIGAIGWSGDYWSLVGLIVMGYVGIGIFHPLATTYTHQLETQKKNLVMGFFIATGTVGFAVGPILSAALVDAGGLKATPWAMIPGLLALCFLFGLDKHFKASPKPKDKLEPIAKTWFNRKELHILLILCLVGSLRAMVLVGLPAFLPFMWEKAGYQLPVIGLVVGLSALIGGPSGLLGGYLGDRWGERSVLLLSFVPCLILLPLLLETSGWTSFFLFILLSGLLEASLATSLVLGLRGVKTRPNLVSGIVGGFSWGLAGLFMPAFGMLADDIGTKQALYLMMIPLALGTVSVMFLPKSLFRKTTGATITEIGDSSGSPLTLTAESAG